MISSCILHLSPLIKKSIEPTQQLIHSASVISIMLIYLDLQSNQLRRTEYTITTAVIRTTVKYLVPAHNLHLTTHAPATTLAHRSLYSTIQPHVFQLQKPKTQNSRSDGFKFAIGIPTINSLIEMSSNVGFARFGREEWIPGIEYPDDICGENT